MDNRMDFKDFNAFSPVKMLFLGGLTYLAIYYMSPVSGSYDPSMGVVWYLLFSFLFMVFGAWMGAGYRFSGSGRPNALQVFNNGFFNLVLMIAVVGVSLKIIDRFFLRGVSLSAGMGNREAILDAGGGGAISILGGILYPFCYLPIFVLLSRWSEPKRRKAVNLYICWALFFFPTFDSLLIGSRSLMIVNVAILVFYGIYFRFIKFGFGTVVIAPIAAFSILLVSGTVFIERLDYMGLDYLTSSLNSVYGFTVKPNDWIIDKLAKEQGFSFLIYYSWLNSGQYFTHGMFEFFYLYDHFFSGHTYGAFNYGVYYKFIGVIMGDNSLLDAVIASQPRVGTFTSFLGPIFVDFGWFGPLYMFFFGAVSGWIWRRCLSGRVVWMPLYFYFAMMIFFAPVVSFFVSAQGLYTITSFLLFIFVARHSGKLVYINDDRVF